jgi:hypothetical protein
MNEWTIEGDDSMRWDVIHAKPTRTAVVTGARNAREVFAYLPDNYRVTGEGYTIAGRPTVTIAGEDRAGWTLDGYVIPRLASGLMFAEEVPAC